MIINHNIAALNTYRQLSNNNIIGNKSLEKLSSGLRINRAGDDAAGLAISEKMRAQIRGLDQASRNAQDGISMIQTAEGALNEVHSILQRMRELATQAANDTNVEVDRDEIQKEINQLTSEINRIGNTTEFNTQSLLKGGGGVTLSNTGYVTNGTLFGGAAEVKTQAEFLFGASGDVVSGGNDFTIGIGGQNITITFGNTGDSSQDDNVAYNVTSTSATVNISGSVAGTGTSGAAVMRAIAAGLEAVIENNSALNGNVEVIWNENDTFTIRAVAGGTLDGVAGGDTSGEGLYSTAAAGDFTLSGVDLSNSGTTTAAVAAQYKITAFSGVDSVAEYEALVGKGFTIAGMSIEFYNANDGAYTGEAIGVNLSDYIDGGLGTSNLGIAGAVASQVADSIEGVTLTQSGTVLVVTATEAGTAGNNIQVADGGTQSDFVATFQVGANMEQSMTINIGDMRAAALGVAAAAGTEGYTTTNTVTNGTSSQNQEAALDVSSFKSATEAIKTINDAIEKVSAERSKLGAYQNRLEHTINNLGTSSENLTAAESRIRDVDYAEAA